MPANIEIKARLRDRQGAMAIAETLAAEPAQLLAQEDVFFVVPNGRLKLRIVTGDDLPEARGELIHYTRADARGPKQSTYTIAPTREPATLQQALGDALGTLGVVRKDRLVYLVGQTRVHIDRVEGLGDYLELEVVLEPEQSAEDGERIARDLMKRLEIRPDDLVEGAYLDLLLQKVG